MIKLRLPREDDYGSPLHATGLAARVGGWLGAAFGICFLTGLTSHLIQHPPRWFTWPAGPAWIYRVTQGLHVTTGIAAIPLLGIKLWVVSPKFWRRPLVKGLLDGLERLSILVLIGASAFQLLTGLANVAEFYAWTFFFPSVHYGVAWVAIGALAVHVAVKLPIIQRALTEPLDSEVGERRSGLTRRGLLRTAAGAAGLGAVLTVGDKLHLLRPVSVLAQRSGRGPQGLPVNRSAQAARITQQEVGPAYRLTVSGLGHEVILTLADLRRLPPHTAILPIACVEGWSQNATWTGVRLADVIGLLGPSPRGVRVVSLDQGPYGHSLVAENLIQHPDTMLALELEGAALHLDHGYPLRLIAPNRPGALQTKWINRIELL